MDLIKLLIGNDTSKTEVPCFLCFKKAKKSLDIHTIFEIRNNSGAISLSLADMIKQFFPSEDFVFMQACNNCSDLISELYVLFHNRKSNIRMLEYLIKQIWTNVNTIPVINDKSVLKVYIPTYEEFHHKVLKLGEYNENYWKNTATDHKSAQIHTKGVQKCKYCSETFLITEELRSHLKSHRKKRQRIRIYHHCNDCKYKTLSKTTLQAHINKNHLNTRPHICQVCYKGFYNRSNLNEHLKTHDNQRNHVCELCGCSFVHKKSLIEHLRLHADIRPYKCDICHKTFVTSGRRSDHIKRSHMEKTECCLICNKKYSLKKELTRHMNNVHLRTI